MARAILLFLLLLSLAHANGTCSNLPWTLKMHMKGHGFDGRQYSYDLTWHHSSIDVDTFFVTDHLNGSSILNLWLDADGRHLFQFGVERKLARHHLQESIGNSALILDDLVRMRDNYTPCDTSSPELQKWFKGPRKAERVITYQLAPSLIEMKDRWGRKLIFELEPTNATIPSQANQEVLTQTKLSIPVASQEETGLD